MTSRMTAIASVFVTIAATGMAQAQDGIGGMTGLPASPPLPAFAPSSGPAAAMSLVAVPPPQISPAIPEVFPVVEGLESLQQAEILSARLVPNAPLDLYWVSAAGVPSGSGRHLVIMDQITGIACAQQATDQLNKVQDFKCFDASEFVPEMTSVRPPTVAKIDVKTMNENKLSVVSVGAGYGLDVAYAWKKAKGEVCVTLVQNEPTAAVTEMGCAKIAGRDFIREFKVNGPSKDI